MDFNFTDEQEQFRDALRRYLDNEYSFDARQKIVASAAGVDAKHWHAFTELGLTALPVPEAQGGFDGGAFDMLVVMQELGRALVVEPYWATAVGIEALRLAGSHNALLERAAAGEIKLAVAFHEPRARYDLFDIRTTARAEGDAFALTGEKSIVQHAAQADHWIVPARLDGEIALFLIARDAAGAEVTEYRTIDGQRAATLKFTGTPATRLGDAHVGAATFEQIADYATLLLCAEADRRARCAESRDRRLHEGPPAVRHADRAFPGVAAPDGRDADPRRAGALDHVSRCRPLCSHGRRRASPGDLRREGAGRAGRALRRPAGGAVARRHGRDERSRGGALVQAAFDH